MIEKAFEMDLNDIRISNSNCIGFMRYFFAFSLIIVHFCSLADVECLWPVNGGLRVKFFFSITGFLVTYSFLRSRNIFIYVRKRFLRIIPAYATCILFCLLLGMVLTTLPKSDFICSSETRKYFLSNIVMLNWLHPCLPGVFVDNYMPQMNGSLWSMKFEMLFYVTVPAYIFLIRRFSAKRVVPILLIAIMLSYNHLPIQFQYSCFFIAGSCVLLLFDWLEKYWKVLLPVCGVVFAVINFAELPESRWLDYIFPIIDLLTFPVLILLLAYHIPCLNRFGRSNNISYGMYLYHFPIIQFLLSTSPFSQMPVYVIFIIALVLTLMISALSWYGLEKKCLSIEPVPR